ncbi:indole-3-glycerol phosphate synthase TrpC [Streptomyces sp. NPDC001828]|uniref:indole-3-glycerol phosphate synthase TrpC n=1 Tax=Streptomyces sp. NPDC001828 TaxID=3364615 RepID=UPI0036C99A7C
MNTLDELVEGARADLVVRQRRFPKAELRRLAEARGPARDCAALLRGDDGVRVVAEVKRASPSKGALAPIADPAALAAAYEAGGAVAVSVLTEGRRFGGSLADLEAVAERVQLPLLRKDFVVDPYQVWEARAYGAELVLLVVAALDQPTLSDLHALAVGIGLTPLVEAHDEAEVERALRAGARVVGVNARDLRTLDVDRTTFARLAPAVPEGVVRVAESGVRGPADVIAYASHGADAVLVGEALVTGGSPGAAVAALVAAGRRAPAAG